MSKVLPLKLGTMLLSDQVAPASVEMKTGARAVFPVGLEVKAEATMNSRKRGLTARLG